MILINVLPPEFRKRDTGVSPVFLAVLIGVLLNLGLISAMGYVRYIRIPYAEAHLSDRQDELTIKKAEEAQVRKIEQTIQSAKTRRDTLFNLLGQKVFQSRPLNDFVSLLTAESYTQPGFMVSVSRLTITPSSGNRPQRGTRNKQNQGPELQEVTWDWSFKIVGEQEDMAGNYIKSFFQTVANSEFWTLNQFTGHPAKSYTGDAPEFNEAIERVVVNHQLQWQRVVTPVQFVAKPKLDVTTGQETD
jgi:hypothetical protein